MPTVALWRCPHCSAPQPETARCWVCRRSTTCCATCRHFRRAVSPGIGFCGLDPRRQALRGDEVRGCWAAPSVAASGARLPAGDAPAGSTAPPPPGGRARAARAFVPLDELLPVTVPPTAINGVPIERAGADTASSTPPPASPDAAPQWSLWPEEPSV